MKIMQATFSQMLLHKCGCWNI